MRAVFARLGASKLIHAAAMLLIVAVGTLMRPAEPPEILRIDRSGGMGADRFAEEWIGPAWSWRRQEGRVQGAESGGEGIPAMPVRSGGGGRRWGLDEEPPLSKVFGMESGALSYSPLLGLAINESIGAGGGSAGKYGLGRGVPKRRMKVVSKERGALYRALTWLERHQDEAGLWDPASACAACGDVGRGGGEELEVTALCVLAFLAGGHDHGSARFGLVVRKGLEFLMMSQDLRGRVGSTMGSHALGTEALWRAALRTGSPILIAAGLRARRFGICNPDLPELESRGAVEAMARRWQASQAGSCRDGSWEPGWIPWAGRIESTARGALLLARLHDGP